MSNRSRQFRLQPSQDPFDHKKQTAYCIQFSKKHFQNQKKQSFLNKLTFQYSLQKINRQKLIGNIIPFSSRIYPTIKNQGNKFCNIQYSSDIYKQSREKLMSQRYELEQLEFIDKERNRDQFRKYRQIISKRKNQGGGIDSFWIFKKSPVKEEKKKAKGVQGESGNGEGNEQNTQNKIQQAFMKILTYAKLPLQLQNSLIPKNTFKNYISSIFGQTFCLWFISFYQIKNYINFKQFQSLSERFSSISLRECHLVSFFLYDDNGDGFLCARDLFAIFDRLDSKKIERDILRIGEFIRGNVGNKDIMANNQDFKIENICIRDDWLTVKDYQIYFKKVDEPYLKATNKKDTVFSKSFAVLDHRQKIRSKRRQLNQKKNMYQQLYGELKNKKSQVYIDSDSDYRLNYAILYNIFGKKSTQVFEFFLGCVFGGEARDYEIEDD